MVDNSILERRLVVFSPKADLYVPNLSCDVHSYLRQRRRGIKFFILISWINLLYFYDRRADWTSGNYMENLYIGVGQVREPVQLIIIPKIVIRFYWRGWQLSLLKIWISYYLQTVNLCTSRISDSKLRDVERPFYIKIFQLPG